MLKGDQEAQRVAFLSRCRTSLIFTGQLRTGQCEVPGLFLARQSELKVKSEEMLFDDGYGEQDKTLLGQDG